MDVVCVDSNLWAIRLIGVEVQTQSFRAAYIPKP